MRYLVNLVGRRACRIFGLTTLLVVLSFASTAFAQETTPEQLDLSPYFQNIFLALAPAFAYVLTFFLARVKDKIPVFVLPLAGPALGWVLAYVNGLAASSEQAVIAAAWGGLAVVIHELQQKFSQWASGGAADNLVALVRYGVTSLTSKG